MARYRNYWKCRRCGHRWSFECNLYDYDGRCPECGKLTTTKTWQCVRSDEPQDITMRGWGGDH